MIILFLIKAKIIFVENIISKIKKYKSKNPKKIYNLRDKINFC